jgi:hypothetical protein
VAFLAEDATPRVTRQWDGITDQVLVKVRHDVAAVALDPRAIARSSGS